MRARAIDAAKQAMRVDPGNSLATTALAIAKPLRGNWLACERQIRQAMAQHPHSGVLTSVTSCLLTGVGRDQEAAALLATLRMDGQGPGLYFREVVALWASGQLEAADRLLEEARELYPTHFALWFTDCYIKMYTGRAGSSVAMIKDVYSRPTGIPAEEFDTILLVANALLSRDILQVDAAIKVWINRAHLGAGYAENAIQFATALGRIDTAFEIADAYYFGRGFEVPEVRFTAQQGSYTPLTERQTAFLFNGSLVSFRADARFARLTNELGLKAYWDASKSVPDFLRS
jgi:tetratricopeptide (TPR) repeat protein